MGGQPKPVELAHSGISAPNPMYRLPNGKYCQHPNQPPPGTPRVSLYCSNCRARYFAPIPAKLVQRRD